MEGCSHDVDKPPEERENQPISELALQDEPVQQIPATSAEPPQPAKTAELGGWHASAVDSNRQGRQSDIGRYGLVQYVDSAGKEWRILVSQEETADREVSKLKPTRSTRRLMCRGWFSTAPFLLVYRNKA